MSAMKICPQCGTEYELDQRFCPKDGSTLKSQANASGDLLGHIIADRYNVLKKLGEGGMGTVYLAEHIKMGRKSAVKVMNPDMVHDADAISRFNREAANASRINHPNVAAVYDFGETSEGLIYLAMEFIEGPSLTKVIEDAGALPPSRAAEITRQASEALAVAHDMGIVHRDLKPDNIMLAKGRDGEDVVKVVDFGIAKAANNEAQKVTKTGLVVGTPEYMSPEQLAGDKLDGRSDTYSLGLVAFNMMTGKLPFPAETVQESMIMRLMERPRQLAEMKADVAWTAEVQAVLDKALERNVAERYQTASEFGRALSKAVESMPSEELTDAFTAVMSPVKAAATVAEPKPATPGKAVPPTRVNPATPQSAPVVPAAKSRTKMLVAAGIILVAVIGGGAVWTKFIDAAGNPNGVEQGDTTQPVTPRSATPALSASELAEKFAEVERLTDIGRGADTATARAAMHKLDSLDALVTAEPDKVRINIIRAEANLLLEELTQACGILLDNEGRTNRTRDSTLIMRRATLYSAACTQ
ncbi:MAG: serine/threonine-protein kinase [Gemmatimonadaceae bacterium]